MPPEHPSPFLTHLCRLFRPSHPPSTSPLPFRTYRPRKSYTTPSPSPSSPSPPPRPPTPTPPSTKTHHRLQKLLNNLPPSLQKYTSRLKNAPISHIASFLILHEITAVVPLVGLAGVFHWIGGGVPEVLEKNEYLNEGIEKFGRWFRRKGWFGFGQEGGEGQSVVGKEEDIKNEGEDGNEGKRILIEVAAAYAVTKLLLPVRIAFSVWATPWFAGVVLGKGGSWVGRVFGRWRS